MQITEPAEYAMLGLLQNQPMHGYELFQQFQKGILHQIIHLEMSQMYAFLKKLERIGSIEAQIEEQGPRPPRKVFHITDAGQRTFTEWLTEPLVRPREIRILFLIKLYFAQRYIPRETTRLIEQQIAACQVFLQQLEARHVSQPVAGPLDDDRFFDLVVLRERIYQTRSLLAWLQELLHDLAAMPSES